MSQFTDYAEGIMRQFWFRTGTPTKPTTLGIGLLTAAPNDASTGATVTEVADQYGYSRVARNPLDANWTAASSTDGKTDNAASITFTASGGNWGTVTHVGIFDSTTHGAGNLICYAPLAASKTINDGDSATFDAGTLSITIS